ncbi:MAG: hypothetical protein JF887_04630 [Candidatus Dormibacteraeota bacterium]|uniref:Uncharacterized protein n=1 Tax=Candidatus Amunia macphersoniae TaxID=3127014 RepID=A0A934KP74_9BACT|nr:hypothetical protein [Candidatus Dormibacteraeota bacterium]
MSIREIAGKMVGFGLTAAALIVGGILVLVGPHAYNDYLNVALGVMLILLGLGAGGFGTMVVAGVVLDARAREREARLHVTPRQGPPSLPPPWGMGDIGRPGAGNVANVGDEPRGGGSVRVMNVVTRNIDAPLIVGALIAWTIVALLIAAPR